MTTRYLSNQGVCLCEDHIGKGGAYLEAEVREPNSTVSFRTTTDGIEIINTPLDNWLIITDKLNAEMPDLLDGIECDECERNNTNE